MPPPSCAPTKYAPLATASRPDVPQTRLKRTKPKSKKKPKKLSKEAREKAENARDLALREAGALGHINPAWDRAGELVHTGGRYKVKWGELPQDVHVVLRGDQHAELHRRVVAGEEARG